MQPSRRPFILGSILIAAALAGCTQPAPPPDDGDDPGPDDGPGDGDGPSASAALAWRSHPFLGEILADADGRTLYVFTRDAPGTSACSGGCAANWPPVLTEAAPTAPGDAAARLGTIDRDDGGAQVTIDERPLYLFVGDAAPGDANGQARGGVWFVVRRTEAPGTLNVDFLDGPGEHQVRADDAPYAEGATGLLARPQAAGAFPGVVMIHEWWGLNDHIKAMARALASHGYAVLAVDLFNGSVATTADEARALVGGLDQDEATANMRAAAAFLREEAGAPVVASLGWCFGGGQSLSLALSGEALGATVIYYGNLVSEPQRLEAIEWPVLGVFGADDTSIPVDEVEAFEAALDDAGVENAIHVYPGVGHAFANPSGQAYNAAQAMDAWSKTLAFLEEHVGSAPL